MPHQPGPPGLSPGEIPMSRMFELQRLPISPEVQEDLTEMQRESARSIVSRVSLGTRTRQRLGSMAEEQEPQLFVVSPTLSRSPALQDAQQALLFSFGEGEAFDFLEGVNSILNNTMIPEHRAVDVMDRLIRFDHVKRLEDI